jgi:hypothetical protein
MNGNDFVKFALRSPLHLFMGNTMLITMTGRKTGREISVPVNYFSEGDTLWIISTRTRTWWRNVGTGAEVTLHLHGRDVKGFAEAVLDEKAVAARIGGYVIRLPMSAKPLGVRVENGVANCDDTARLAKERLFVKICLS